MYAIQRQDSAGTLVVEVYDRNDREVLNTHRTASGSTLAAETDYDSLGRVLRKALPHFTSSSPFWITPVYDGIGRIIQETSPAKASAPTGRVTKTSYRGLTTIQTNARGYSTTRTQDVLGQWVRVTNALGQSLSYDYDAAGRLEFTTDPNGNRIEQTWDLRGRKLTQKDPDLGLWKYSYNGYDEPMTQTDAKGQVQKLVYDALGRLIQRDETEGRTTWTWDSARKGFLSQVRQTTPAGTETVRRAYSPDAVGNLASESLYLDGVLQGTTSYTYDSQNRLDLRTYPSGFKLKHRYNTYGALYELRQDSDSGYRYWAAGSWDVWDKIASYTLCNGKTTTVNRDAAVGMTAAINTASGALQAWTYDWDANGNITKRQTQVSGQAYTETATYDALDRIDLNAISTGQGSWSKQTTYDALGNVKSWPDVGSYSYASSRVHAVTGTTVGNRTYNYDANGNLLYADTASGRRSYVWASYNLPTQITLGSQWTTIAYGPEREKVRQSQFTAAEGNRSLVYAGPGSEKHVTASATQWRELIVAPSGIVAQRSLTVGSGAVSLLYLHADAQGSIEVLSDSAGTAVSRLGYDRWGQRRDADGWGSATGAAPTAKGYTGHTMEDSVGVIHLGGRVYDPLIGRFTSPDPILQAPGNLQSYNRYSYVANNPLSLTDPSGYSWLSNALHRADDWLQVNWRTVAALAIAVATPYAAVWAFNVSGGIAALSSTQAVLAGAIGGFASGMVGSGGDLQAGLIGAVSGAAFAGIGQTIGKGASYRNMGRMFAKTVAHGLVGGGVSVAQGGRFGQGFLSTGVSAFFAPGIAQLSHGNAAAGTLLSASLGGTTAALGGGKFANGAVTGAFSYALNQAMHKYTTQFGIGRDAHRTLQSYAEELDPDNVFADVASDGKGAFFGGRPDIRNSQLQELWEIKSELSGVSAAAGQLLVYTTASGFTYAPGGPEFLFGGGFSLTLPGSLATYTYRLVSPGVILYNYQPHPNVNVIHVPTMLPIGRAAGLARFLGLCPAGC